MTTQPDLAELRRLLDDMRDLATREGIYNGNRAVLDIIGRVEPLLDAAAERDALAALRAAAEAIARAYRARAECAEGLLVSLANRAAGDHAEIEALRSQLAGRCLSDITHRDEEHRQSVCMLPAEHAPLAHDDCMGCTWTDADHWQPQAVDRLADELARIADESQHEGWDSPAVRRVVDRLRAAFEEPQP